MKTNSIPTTLSEGLDSRINYRYSSRMFVNVAIWLIVAIASAVILFSADIDQKSPLYFILGLMAVIGLLVAVLTFLFTKKEPRLSDTNQRLSCYTYYFDASQSAIDEAIRNRRFEHLKSLINIHDAGIRLDMLCTDDATIARYRLYKYIPFEYQPISEITELDPATATALKSL